MCGLIIHVVPGGDDSLENITKRVEADLKGQKLLDGDNDRVSCKFRLDLKMLLTAALSLTSYLLAGVCWKGSLH